MNRVLAVSTKKVWIFVATLNINTATHTNTRLFQWQKNVRISNIGWKKYLVTFKCPLQTIILTNQRIHQWNNFHLLSLPEQDKSQILLQETMCIQTNNATISTNSLSAGHAEAEMLLCREKHIWKELKKRSWIVPDNLPASSFCPFMA